MRRLLFSLCLISVAVSIFVLLNRLFTLRSFSEVGPTLYPSVVPSPPRDVEGPTTTPTPKPLSFAQLNSLYGPCTKASVLMYHHIDSKKSSLSVSPENFSAHLAYLKTQGYTVVPVTALNDFFDRHVPLPAKAVILTFDDAYADFFSAALPLLQTGPTPAVLFVPTGLVNNPGYASWSDLSSAPNYIYFANHTWSHSAIVGEIPTAQTQLSDHGFNSAKIFAYAWGAVTPAISQYLTANNYSLAFTTRPGSTHCAKQRLSLPRLRAPNSSLSAIGL